MPARNLRSGIESPRPGAVPERAVTIRGWCFDPEGADRLKGVRARVGSAVFEGRRKQTRWGVAQMFPGCPAALKSGFSIDIDLRPGRSHVTVEARTPDGNWHAIGSLDLDAPRRWRWPRHLFRATPPRPDTAGPRSYQDWVAAYDTPDAAALTRWRERCRSFPFKPRISVVLPVFNPPPKLLEDCLASVAAQIYPNWDLCAADDASTHPHVRPALEAFRDAHPGKVHLTFRPENGHISAASNSALATVTGEFLALLDHDDLLPPHALAAVAAELQDHPDALLLYSDEDKIDAAGLRQDPYFKADFDPDLLLAQNCVSHLGVYQTAAVRDAGGFRTGFEGSQDWDLALRVTAGCPPRKVRHIPHVLYHWRLTPGSTSAHKGEKPYAEPAGAAAVEGSLKTLTEPRPELEVEPGGFFHIRHPLPEPPPEVAIVVPTRDRHELVTACLESVWAKTDYPAFRVLLVDNGSTDPLAIAAFEALEKRGVHVLRDGGDFNFARLNNRAVEAAPDAKVIIFLNNDTEAIAPGWLREMVSHAVRPDIGAVGAKLLYSDGTIQHAGVFLGFAGAAGHLFRGLPAGHHGQGQWANLTRRTAAVTAACMAVERQKYLEVGGMDEQAFGVAYNDVDLCLKLAAAGYHSLVTPYALLYHHESKSRGSNEARPDQKARANRETAALHQRWGALLPADPRYNPNLTLDHEDASLAFPPRSPATGGIGHPPDPHG